MSPRINAGSSSSVLNIYTSPIQNAITEKIKGVAMYHQFCPTNKAIIRIIVITKRREPRTLVNNFKSSKFVLSEKIKLNRTKSKLITSEIKYSDENAIAGLFDFIFEICINNEDEKNRRINIGINNKIRTIFLPFIVTVLNNKENKLCLFFGYSFINDAKRKKVVISAVRYAE